MTDDNPTYESGRVCSCGDLAGNVNPLCAVHSNDETRRTVGDAYNDGYAEGYADGWAEALRALHDHHRSISDASEGVTTRSVHMVIADAAKQFAATNNLGVVPHD